jgi:drug/metabolite transporter (DMT)-like permease
MTFRVALSAMLLATLIWASSFAIMKNTLLTITPALFLALRATIGTLALVWVKPDRKAVAPGLLLGSLVAIAMVFEILALATTSASKVAFILASSAFLAPLISAVLFKRAVPLKAYAAFALAVVGLALLVLSDVTLIMNVGDGLAFIAALFFAMYLAVLGETDSKVSVFYLAFCRSLPITLIAWVWAFPQVGSITTLPAATWLALLYIGLLAGTFAHMLQIWSQHVLPVYMVVIILALEPIFAALIAFVWLGEQFTQRGLLGALLVLVAVLIVTLPGTSKRLS